MGSASSKNVAISARPDESEDEKSIAILRNKVTSMSINSQQVSVPTSVSGTLSLANLTAWEEALRALPNTQLARTVLAHSTLPEALIRRQAQIASTHVFNTQIDFKTSPITNQRSSGRCWLFASTSLLRYDIMRKLKLNDFQLSQSYLFFYDKLNKANYYLELSIENADLPNDDRLIVHLADDLVSDGGQWDMVVNLLENYGSVPQSIYPESASSSASSSLNTLIRTKLREHALILRKLSAQLKAMDTDNDVILSQLRAKKEQLMEEIYSIMTATLGKPPKPDEKFVWEYYDADGKFGQWDGTPKDFFEAFAEKPYSPLDCFSLINDPRNQYGKLYTVDKLGNVWGGRPVLYVNTDLENMKAKIVKMIKGGHPVFFGCDVGQSSDRVGGIMDTALYDYEATFNVTLGLSKAERLQVKESAMTHAMLISAVHLENGRPVRYKVENSWGEAVGNSGYFVMTDAWFDQFVYQIVVPKQYAPTEYKILEAGSPVVLPPWDPMGALA